MSNPPPDPKFIERVLQELSGQPYERQREILRARLPTPFPQFLYKYRRLVPGEALSEARLRQLMVRSQLWMSPPRAFGDPFDLAGRVVVPRDYHTRYAVVSEGLIAQFPSMGAHQRRARRKSLLATGPEQLEQELQARFDKLADDFGVCAFAGDPFSLPMWSQHAANHTGLCLQFEVVRDFAVFAHASPVEYARAVPLLDWTGELESGMRSVLLRRHEDWSHERERRIVGYGRAATALDFQPAALTGVMLGCRMSAQGCALVEKLLAERRAAGLPDIARYRMERHPQRYALRVVRVV